MTETQKSHDDLTMELEEKRLKLEERQAERERDGSAVRSDNSTTRWWWDNIQVQLRYDAFPPFQDDD